MNPVTAEMIERGRGTDPKVIADRRKMQLHMHVTRDKLASHVGESATQDIEMLKLFSKSRMDVVPGTALLAFAVAGIVTLWLPLQSLIYWFVFQIIALGLSYALSLAYAKDRENFATIGSWRNKFLLAECIQGVAWALLVTQLLIIDTAATNAFALILMISVAAMSGMTSSSMPMSVFAGLMPPIIAVIAMMPRGAGYGGLVQPAMAVLALAYFVFIAHRLQATTHNSVAFRAEKDALIAELEQAKANSDEARRRSEESNLAKSRFLATMSHELRTPLNAILGFSEVMKNELFGAHLVPAYKEYASDVHSSGQHLLMLINEILDLSRVEAGRYDLKEEAVSLPNAVDDCRHLLTLRAKNKSLSVVTHIEETLPRIWADERAVRQVTLNLLSNAIKFTPTGGQITIKVGWTAAGGQYLSIKDTGPGIPENEIPVVMSSFGRGSLAHKTAEEGTGLGLPIVKGLVELHGGTFILKSKLREGTEVLVLFPPERVMNALTQIEEEKPPVVKRRFAAQA